MGFLGVSAFAITQKNFPLERFLKQFPKKMPKPCIAILPGSFGWEWENVGAFCEKFSAVPHLIEVHISCGPARRKNMFPDCDFAAGYSVGAFNEAWECDERKLRLMLAQWMEKVLPGLRRHTNAKTKFICCPELEDNMADKAWRKFAASIAGLWDVRIVRNPCMGGDDCGKHREFHGPRYGLGPAHIGNLDGVSVNVGDGENYVRDISPATAQKYLNSNRKALACMLWSATQQGIGQDSSYSKPRVHPDKRKYVVTDQALRAFRRMLAEAAGLRGARAAQDNES